MLYFIISQNLGAKLLFMKSLTLKPHRCTKIYVIGHHTAVFLKQKDALYNSLTKQGNYRMDRSG